MLDKPGSWATTQTSVPALWCKADVTQITTTRTCVVFHRPNSLPLYLEHELVSVANGVSRRDLEARASSPLERQRLSLAGRPPDFAVVGFLFLVAAILVGVAWLR